MIRLLVVLGLVACGPGVKGGPTMTNKMGNNDTATTTGATSPVVSQEILQREPLANTAEVKHILISWKELGAAFGGRQDARATKRTKAEAETVVKSLVGQLKAGGDFSTLMKANSEDSGSAAGDRAFTVRPDSQLVLEFRQLALRLKVDEIGVCESDFGFHIIKRLQ
jgi:hypothetical protein